MYLNKAFIFGNLTRDPELRTLPSGAPVAAMGVATNRVFRDKEGNNKEETQFHNVVVFGRQAETVSQYLRKGSSVLVEGRIQTRSWDGPDGNKRYKTEIVADRVQFGPRGARGGGEGRTDEGGSSSGGKDTNTDTINYPDEEANPDDIPF